MFAAFVAVLIVQILVVAVAELAGGDGEQAGTSDVATIGFTVVLDLSLVAFTVAVVAWLAEPAVRRRPPSGCASRSGGPRWAGRWPPTRTFWIAAIVVGIAFGQPEEQDIVVDLKAEDSVLILAGFAVMTCVLAPLAEEFFFRGFLLRVLHERTNAVIAVLVTGIAFGLVHLPSGDWIGTIVLSLFGMALCVLFLLTSSLLPCIMLHAFHNSISFGFTKELPWWGFLLLTVASVMTTLAIALLATRIRSAPA